MAKGVKEGDRLTAGLNRLGADGWDFVPVVREMPLPEDMALRFIFPHAPIRPVTLNNGMEMPAWYDIAMSDISRLPEEKGLRESQAAIERLISRERDRGIDSTRIVLAGFSQGGALALQTGLRHANRLGGIVALSTYLALEDSLDAEASSANKATPILMATGTEVALAVAAYERLSGEGVRARVVSMPSWNLFERQDAEYREQVLPRAVTARVAVEQASDFGWDRYVGIAGTTIAMRSFGMSAPLKDLQRRFGFTPDAVAEAAREQLGT